MEIYRVGKLFPRNFTDKCVYDPTLKKSKALDKYTKIAFSTAYTLRKKLNKDAVTLKQKPPKYNPFKKKRK